MALIQSLPVAIDLDTRVPRRSPPIAGAMAPAGSVIYPDRAAIEVSTRFCRGAAEAGSRTPSNKRRAMAGRGRSFGTRSYSHEDLIGDWSDWPLDVGLTAGLGPPRIIPVSGQLERRVHQALIRPTAFKPVVPQSRSAAHFLSPGLCSGLSGSQGNLSTAGDEDSVVLTGRRGSYSGVRTGLVQSFSMTDATKHHTHSNSDSGRSSSSKSTTGPLPSAGPSPPPAEALMRELEERLREKERELQQLRANLNKNEAAICQVYEERQKRTELEMEEFRQTCAGKMHAASQRSQREQQLLQVQLFQLQQEKKQTQEELAQLTQEHHLLEERCATLEREQTQITPRLEETKWEVCQKSGEISLLKQQLKDLQADVAQRAGELTTLRGQLREVRGELHTCQTQQQEAHTSARARTLELEVCQNELQRRKSENELLREKLCRLEDESSHMRDVLRHLRGGGAPTEEQANENTELKASLQQVEQLKAELSFERQRVSSQASSFENERKSWEEEKEKVIRYQRELQQNYVQMYRRNRDLERSLRQLSLELESRDQDDDSSGNEVTFDDVAATEI